MDSNNIVPAVVIELNLYQVSFHGNQCKIHYVDTA